MLIVQQACSKDKESRLYQCAYSTSGLQFAVLSSEGSLSLFDVRKMSKVNKYRQRVAALLVILLIVFEINLFAEYTGPYTNNTGSIFTKASLELSSNFLQ